MWDLLFEEARPGGAGCRGLDVRWAWLGGTFLDYSVLAAERTTGQHIGILVSELGVGVTVAFTMVSLFVSFNRHLIDRQKED